MGNQKESYTCCKPYNSKDQCIKALEGEYDTANMFKGLTGVNFTSDARKYWHKIRGGGNYDILYNNS